MRKFLLIILCFTFLSEAYLSLASMPVAVKITGCIVDGYLVSEETDFGTHKVNRNYKIKTVDSKLKPFKLSHPEGKKITASGSLLPGDTFIVKQRDIISHGLCYKNKSSNLPEIGSVRAQELIWGLPEVRELSIRIRSKGKRPFTRLNDPAGHGIVNEGDGVFYIILFGEDHDTHTVNIMTFYVNAYTGSIQVYESVPDIRYSIEQWRKMRE